MWQERFLIGIGEEVKRNMAKGSPPYMPIRRTVSSGHGIGKSTMAAWLVDWVMVTRPRTHGTVTANSFPQLSTKTWAAIQKWTSLCIFGHWFTCGAKLMYHNGYRADWQMAPQSSEAENSEAFAGQHSKGGSSFYLFDEASAIPDIIFTVAEGGLTDGEPMIFLFGNATRNSGWFYDATFGKMRSKWNPTLVDSRESKFTNKEQIAEWLADYGEDSDFFKVRVRGLAPNASDAQFIDQGRVLEAQKRRIGLIPDDEPLLAGVDFAWGGSDDNVIRFRRGIDARSIPSIRIKGEFTRDSGVMTNRLADVLTADYGGGRRVHTMFVDSSGIAGRVVQNLRDMGHRNVIEVNFGAFSPNPKRRFMRDHIWAEMKDWLATGCIDKHPELETDLTAPGLKPDNQQRIWLEDKETMKKRGVDSPDDGDALALTFAAPVKIKPRHRPASLPTELV